VYRLLCSFLGVLDDNYHVRLKLQDSPWKVVTSTFYSYFLLTRHVLLRDGVDWPLWMFGRALAMYGLALGVVWTGPWRYMDWPLEMCGLGHGALNLLSYS